MTRIIAGRAGGRRIAVPPAGTRPTSDRVREALFSALPRTPAWTVSRCSTCAPGRGRSGWRRSRGGPRTRCSSRRTGGPPRAAAQRRRTRAPGRGRCAPRPPRRCSPRPRTGAYDVVLVDPPYAVPDAEVAGLARGRCRARLAGRRRGGGRRARPGRRPSPGPRRWSRVRERRYGDTVLHVGVAERAVEKRVAHDAGHNRHGASPAGSVPAHEARRLPRFLRPGDQRAPRHRRPRGRPVRRGRRGRAGEQDQAQPVHRRGTDRDAGGGHRRPSPTSRSARSTACSSTTAATTTSGPSSRVCAPSPTSTTSCRWRR